MNGMWQRLRYRATRDRNVGECALRGRRLNLESRRRFSGATNSARPVVSVVRRSPFEKVTTAPEVRRPFASSTARVARSPEMIVRGRIASAPGVAEARRFLRGRREKKREELMPPQGHRLRRTY